MARSSHSAVLVNRDVTAVGGGGGTKTYMLVFGGCPFTHGDSGQVNDGKNTNCFTNEMLILDLTCGATLGWVSNGGTKASRLPDANEATPVTPPSSPSPRSLHGWVAR
jgi:hypothetical protein